MYARWIRCSNSGEAGFLKSSSIGARRRAPLLCKSSKIERAMCVTGRTEAMLAARWTQMRNQTVPIFVPTPRIEALCRFASDIANEARKAFDNS